MPKCKISTYDCIEVFFYTKGKFIFPQTIDKISCEGVDRFLNHLLHVKIKWTIFFIREDLNVANEEKTRTTVEIHNRTYTIIGTEPQNHIKLVASLVDQKMNEIQEANRQLDTTRLAVLTAVNTMNDYLKLKEEYASLLGSMKKKED